MVPPPPPPHIARVIQKPKKHVVYKGAKFKISTDLLGVIYKLKPECSHFYDCFGGGGSMSDAAHASGYITCYNEKNRDIWLLLKWLKENPEPLSEYGRFPAHWYNYISKADFKRLKVAEPSAYRTLMLLSYSFGSNMSAYQCSDANYKISMLYHNLILFKSQESAAFFENFYAEYGWMFNRLLNVTYPKLDSWQDRETITNGLSMKTGAVLWAGAQAAFKDWTYDDFITKSQSEVLYNIEKALGVSLSKKRLNYVRLTIPKAGDWPPLPGFNFTEPAKSRALKQLKNLGLHSINYPLYNMDYKDFIKELSPPPKSIIYCDPPYEGTTCYAGFDINHEEFLDWARGLDYPVFISEYKPKILGFRQVWEKGTRCSLNNYSLQGDAQLRTERLFWNGK